MSGLHAAVAEELRRILAEENLTVAAAARMLGVSRQAFHDYLKPKSIPRPAVLARAWELWGFSVTLGSVTFDGASFALPDNKPPKEAQQLELELWKKLDSISERDLHIQFERQGGTLKVEVRIDIPA